MRSRRSKSDSKAYGKAGRHMAQGGRIRIRIRQQLVDGLVDGLVDRGPPRMGPGVLFLFFGTSSSRLEYGYQSHENSSLVVYYNMALPL